MSDRDPTPTDADLLAFDRGLLPDNASDAVARWLEAHPEFPSMPRGPSRDDWLAITGQPAQTVVR